MRLIIAGSREITSKAKVFRLIDGFIAKHGPITEIVSGGARGVDQLGEQYAKAKNIALRQFIPNWDLHGKAAGYRRNEEMARHADALLAIWDGQSKGTSHMIQIAKQSKLLIEVEEISLVH